MPTKASLEWENCERNLKIRKKDGGQKRMERKISTSFDYRFTPQTSRAGHQSSAVCFWLKYARSIQNYNNQNVCNLLHFLFLQIDFRLFYSGKHLVQLFDKELLLWNKKRKDISKSKVSKIRYCWIHNSHFSLCKTLYILLFSHRSVFKDNLSATICSRCITSDFTDSLAHIQETRAHSESL